MLIFSSCFPRQWMLIMSAVTYFHAHSQPQLCSYL